MVAFHFDANVARPVALFLPPYGHTAVTAEQLGLKYAADADHLFYAARHRRVLVTRDKGFIEMHWAWRRWPAFWGVIPLPQHAGVLIIPDAWRPPIVAQELDAFLQLGWPLANACYRHQGARGWVSY